MNHGPLIFLGVLASFLAAWWGLVFAPQVQIGSQQATQGENGAFPVRRLGLAEQGREVYVANGCVHCHSQQVRQEGYTFNIEISSPGTNIADVAKVLARIAPKFQLDAAIINASEKSPMTVLKAVPQKVAASSQGALTEAGASAQAVFIPLGADITRHWGTRRSVAADYLFDQPVQVGNSRLGPDLSNIGARMPLTGWHLLHLYHPHTVLPGSVMPAYRYLFETRPVGKRPSPDALKLTGQFAPPAGFEVVPKPEAQKLVAYLQSLRVETSLFEAPLTPVPAPVADTNAPAAGGTTP